MQLTIQIISYWRLNARADRIFRGAHMQYRLLLLLWHSLQVIDLMLESIFPPPIRPTVTAKQLPTQRYLTIYASDSQDLEASQTRQIS